MILSSKGGVVTTHPLPPPLGRRVTKKNTKQNKTIQKQNKTKQNKKPNKKKKEMLRKTRVKHEPKFSADSANAFSFYEVFCEQRHLLSVP